MPGVAVFSRGNLSPGERPVPTAGSLHRPEGGMDHRREYHWLAWHRSLRLRWCAADLETLCARLRCQSSCRDPELTDCIRVCPSCDPISAECNALLQLAT